MKPALSEENVLEFESVPVFACGIQQDVLKLGDQIKNVKFSSGLLGLTG
jgi:hypothetical protein